MDGEHVPVKERHLVAEEADAIGKLHANMGVLLGLFTLVLVSFVAGSGWPEWANNGWSILHVYAPFVVICLVFMIRMPIDALVQSSPEAQSTHRAKYIDRTRRFMLLSYYVLAISALMEIGATAYLIQAIVRESDAIARNLNTRIAAFTISSLFLVLIGSMWYVVWRLDKYHTEKVYTENVSRTLLR